MTTNIIYRVALLLLVTVSAVLAEDDPRRVPIPDGVFYYRPAAVVSGSEAAWLNPAGLGKLGAAGFQVMADYYNGDYARSWGAVVYRDRVTTGYRKLKNPNGEDFDEAMMATGVKFGPALSVGMSYRYFREGPAQYRHRHYWNLGILKRGNSPLALAAVFSNINRGRINGERSATEQRYSAGIRPLKTELTLAVDMMLSTRDNLSAADYVYHAEFIPTPGLYLTGSIDSDKNFQIGVRANLLKYFVGSQSTFNKCGHDGRTTAYFGATNMRQPSLIDEPGRNLKLRVARGMAENPPQPVFGHKSTPFISLILQIYRAADDASVASMNLQLEQLSLGMGQAQELREALAYFKSCGKRIICHLSEPNNIGYFVASIADTILIPPVSQLRLVGLRAEMTFWSGAMDKLGVRAELLRVGDYKTAPEKYTREAASEENREQMNRILDDLYDQFVTTIAEGRNLDASQVRDIIDRGPFTSQEALEAGLVDGLSYRDRVGRDFFADLPTVSFRKYRTDTLTNDAWQPKPTLAVVVAEGEISAERSDSNPLAPSGKLTPSNLSAAYRQALSNREVKGVLLRINSPGGWALAGEKMFHAGDETSEKRPLFVSMSNVAASGGYHIAMPARTVFANPATITGSIGIYGGKLDLSGLYDKISMGRELFTRGKYAGMLTALRPFTDEERTKYQGHLEAFYDYFVNLVAEKRGLPTDSVARLSRGQVWTGREAVTRGLADRTGGIKAALDQLAADLGLEDYDIRLYPEKRPWFIWPGGSLWSRMIAGITGSDSETITEGLQLPLSDDAPIMARLPFDLHVE